jgi:hypothetical protein
MVRWLHQGIRESKRSDGAFAMMSLSIAEAQARFSGVVRAVESGEGAVLLSVDKLWRP